MSYKIHQLAGTTNRQMMAYVITSPDGGVFVIDGGYDEDADYLVDYIKKATGGNRVDAWFMSHPHDDHISAFCEIMEKTPDALDIRTLCYNFPPADYIKKYRNDDGEYDSIVRFNALRPLFADRTVILHDGNSYEFAGLVVDVMYEPDLSITENIVNNSSVLMKFHLGGKTLLITGDLGVEGGNAALSKYGDALKSDIVEMAHHGQNGVARSFYEAVKPECCLWNTPLWLWDNNAGGGYDTYIFKTIIVRGWMSEMEVRRHIVSKDGDQVLEV